MKKIMILGGSPNQVPLLQAAQSEGYYVLLCDSRKTNLPGYKYCDKQYYINTIDKEAVLNVAKKEAIDGIISNSEPAMTTVAYVSEQMSIPGNPLSAIEILTSKDKFRTLQEKVGIYAPKHKVVKTYEEFLLAIKEFKTPFIVKPVECSGSRGTVRIDYLEQDLLKKAYEENTSFSRDGKCSIEEYVEMPSLEVIDGDIFVLGDDIIWDGLFMSVRSPKAPMVPKDQVYPLNLNAAKETNVKNAISAILRAAGVRHGEYNIEMYFTKDDKPFIIEINARQGGNNIPSSIFLHCGIDMYKLLVSTCVGDQGYYNKIISGKRILRPFIRHCVFSYDDGIYNGLRIDKKISKYIHEITELKNKGDKVEKCRNAESIIALVDVLFKDIDEQMHFYRDLDNYISPIVIKN